MADLKSILDSAQAPDEVKASAWDAFKAAQSKDDFKARFSSINLPDETKAALWDAKFSSGGDLSQAIGGLGPTSIGPQEGMGHRAMRSLVNALPAAGATAGGIAGMAASPLGAVTGAGIVGAGGEALQQLIQHAFPSMGAPPETSTEAARRLSGASLMGAGQELGGQALGALAPALRSSAEGNIIQTLAPGGQADKELAKKVAGGLLDRPGTIQLSRGAVERNAAIGVGLEGARVGLKESLAAQEQVPLQPILQSLDKYAANLNVKGTAVVKSEGALAGINDLRQKVVDIGQGNAYASRESLRDFKKFLDEQADKVDAHVFEPAAKTTAEIQKYTADSIRRELNNARPDISKINEEFSFWKDVERVISDTNRRGLGKQSGTATAALTGIGGAAGALLGGYSGAGGGAIAMPLIARLINSAAWNTTSAVAKDQIAKYLATDEGPRAAALAIRLMVPDMDQKKQELADTLRAKLAGAQ